MSSYKTNGYLVGIIKAAQRDPDHEHHGLADRLLTSFRDMENKFFEKVHPFVDMGLTAEEVKIAAEKGTQPSIFTIHGSRHISDLICNLDKIAKSLMKNKGKKHHFDVQEAYTLLCAAHIHDSGNIAGRADHADRCRQTIIDYASLFKDSTISQNIYDIARAHGGKHPIYEKDTIRAIQANNQEKPRLPLLAALLRLGDELSENSDRVPHEIEKRKKGEMASESQLAFAYAESFSSFRLQDGLLSITFRVYEKQHKLTVQVEAEDGQMNDLSFYDFLEDRIEKIEKEARYCSQYGRPLLDITDIKVAIHRFEEEDISSQIKHKDLTLNLNTGYPADQDKTLINRCEEYQNTEYNKLSELFMSGNSNE